MELPIINCPRCFTFWATLVYGMVTVPCGSPHGFDSIIPRLLAISFLASYSALWLELLEGFIDTLYMKLYEKIYPNSANDTLTAADFDGDTDCAVSEL